MVWRPILIVVTALFLSGPLVRAQEANPDSGFEPVPRFPAHVLTGTCEDPGEIAFSLSEGGFGLPVSVEAMAQDDVTASYVGPNEANAAIISVTTLDVSLEELVESGLVIDAHRAETALGNESRLVCGAVGGFRAADDLVFGLQEVNESEYRGTAWLHDNGDTTVVTIFLVSPAGSADGLDLTPAPDDTEIPDAGEEVEPIGPLPSEIETTGLVIEGGAFAAEKLTLLEDVPTTLHLVNSDDRDYIFQLGDLVVAREVPANELSVIDFTTPNSGLFEGQIFDAETGVEVATIPVEVGVVTGIID